MKLSRVVTVAATAGVLLTSATQVAWAMPPPYGHCPYGTHWDPDAGGCVPNTPPPPPTTEDVPVIAQHTARHDSGTGHQETTAEVYKTVDIATGRMLRLYVHATTHTWSDSPVTGYRGLTWVVLDGPASEWTQPSQQSFTACGTLDLSPGCSSNRTDVWEVDVPANQVNDNQIDIMFAAG